MEQKEGLDTKLHTNEEGKEITVKEMEPGCWVVYNILTHQVDTHFIVLAEIIQRNVIKSFNNTRAKV
jgi:hypothetical protein